MAKSVSYSVYDQVAAPSAGGSNPAGKDSSNPCDALGNPDRFKRNMPTVVTESEAGETAELKETREKQLGSNGYQSNGYHHQHDTEAIYPMRGFKKD